MMIRKGDRVRTSLGTVKLVLGREPDGRVIVDVGDGVAVSVSDGTLELLCSNPLCTKLGERFAESDGAALCEGHAVGTRVVDVRTDGARCPCICGEDLAAGKSEGVWTVGDDPTVACEYRTCAHCSSSRAFMPRDVLSGQGGTRLVIVLADLGAPVGEHASLLDALERNPPGDRALLMRGAVVLARAFRTPTGRLGWRVAEPLHESPPRA